MYDTRTTCNIYVYVHISVFFVYVSVLFGDCAAFCRKNPITVLKSLRPEQRGLQNYLLTRNLLQLYILDIV